MLIVNNERTAVFIKPNRPVIGRMYAGPMRMRDPDDRIIREVMMPPEGDMRIWQTVFLGYGLDAHKKEETVNLWPIAGLLVALGLSIIGKAIGTV